MPRLSVKEAAEYVGLGKPTLNAYRVSGGGPVYIKIGGRVVYDTADLDAWLEAHKQRSTSETTDKSTSRRSAD